jgi:flavin-dependent amine oxidoreductase
MPVQVRGRALERGFRALELHYEGTGTPPPLDRYRPEGDGHRPFVHLVDDWVRGLVGDDAVVEVSRPASFTRGRLGPEVLVTSDLRGAPELVDADTAQQIAQEAASAVHEHGPAGLLVPEEGARLAEVALDEASVHQHGRTFHRALLAPFTAKVRPGGGSDVPASLRRKLWVPLFWPQTVAEAFSGRPVAFVPERPLSVVRPGGMGPVVHALLDRLRTRDVDVVAYDRVSGIAADGAQVRVELSDGRVEEARRPVLGIPAGELFAAAGIAFSPEKARSVLAWVDVREADLLELPGFVHVLDPDVPAYRITPGRSDGADSRSLCVELAHDVPEEEAARTAHEVLQRVGLVRAGATTADLGVFAGPTFTDPTTDNLRRHTDALGWWRELAVAAVVVGGAQAPFADSFNEQVLQGLQAAASAA